MTPISSSLRLVLALLPFALAQTSSVMSFFFLDTDSVQDGAFVGSVITASGSTTQYYLTCGPTVDGSDCGFGPGVTVQHAGSVWATTISESDAFSETDVCTIYTSGATSAVCVETAGGSEANFPGTSTTTLEASEVMFGPVTITAGLEKLSGGSAKATSSSSGSKSEQSSGAKSTGSAASATSGAGKTASSSKGTSTGSANGAGITGMAGGALLAGAMGALVMV